MRVFPNNSICAIVFMCATCEVTASGRDAVVAQRIERHTPDVEVAGSSPASSTNIPV